MIQQVEARPDRVPVAAPPARLIDFLALRLLSERFALAYLARETFAWSAPLAGLRPALRKRLPRPTPRTADERAWLLFELARIHGWRAEQIAALARPDVAALLDELDRLPEDERRRLLHLAYERRHRQTTLDALAAYADEPAPFAAASPLRFQSIHCIDEREESLRRHLEEVEPACETYGTAGFFGIAMYYRGVGDAHAVPLCPIAIRPAHEVEEVVVASLREESPAAPRVAALARPVDPRDPPREPHLDARRALELRSRARRRGAAGLPRLSAALDGARAARNRWPGAGAGTLAAADRASRGFADARRVPGFTLDEMTEIVRRSLVDLGLQRASRRSWWSSGTAPPASTTRTSPRTTAAPAAADAVIRTRGRSHRWPTTRACVCDSGGRASTSPRRRASSAPSTTRATMRSRCTT